MKTKTLPIYMLLIAGIGMIATNLKSNNDCGEDANFVQIAISNVLKEYAWNVYDIAESQVTSNNDCQTVSVIITHVDDVQEIPENVTNEDLGAMELGGGKSLSVIIDNQTLKVIDVLRFQ